LIGANAKPAKPVNNDDTLAPSHGRVATMVTAAVQAFDQGISAQDILASVRSEVPTVAASTVNLYLDFTYRGRFDKGEDDRYRLSKQYSDFLLSTDSGEPTIDIVRRVMHDATSPMTANEIIALCENIQYIERSAVRGYLVSGYSGEFSKIGEDTFILTP